MGRGTSTGPLQISVTVGRCGHDVGGAVYPPSVSRARNRRHRAERKAKAAEPNDNLHFGYWFVAFFDLLGIRGSYLETDNFPTNDEEMKALLKKLKNSVGVVQGLRGHLDRFEAGMNDPSHDVRIDGLPPGTRALVKELRQTRVIRVNFSDAIMLQCPLASDSGNFPLRGIYDALQKCASMMMISLAAGHPIRGGLDVGTGILDGGELFGAAPVKAYLLESKCAQYPRLVVGDTLIRRLVHAQQSDTGGVRGQVERQIAERLLSFLKRDDYDQRWIVDYAGPAFRNAMENVPGLSGLLSSALAFAVKSRDQFEQRREGEEQAKLLPRYQALVSYLQRSGPF